MGRAHARVMAARGARIIVHDIDGEGAEETAEGLRQGGHDPLVILADVADVSAMAAAIAGAEAEAGRIDILVNNAGIGGGGVVLEDIDEAAYDRMFDIHVKGAFFATRAAVPGMKRRGSGKIINISSVEGMVAVASRPHYCGAKAALLGLTKAWAKEFAPWGICVNCVAPGWVMTEMVFALTDADWRRRHQEAEIPLGRYAEPEEISALVAFLASAEADFITGQTISPNGGQVIVGI
jgi:3-oxoacyl-[acyl-carrier protein] reductase